MIYGDESEMFDDPVNYEGNNLLEFTRFFSKTLNLKLALLEQEFIHPRCL